MRQIMLSTLVAASVLLLIACGGDAPPPLAEKQPADAPLTSQPAAPPGPTPTDLKTPDELRGEAEQLIVIRHPARGPEHLVAVTIELLRQPLRRKLAGCAEEEGREHQQHGHPRPQRSAGRPTEHGEQGTEDQRGKRRGLPAGPR